MPNFLKIFFSAIFICCLIAKIYLAIINRHWFNCNEGLFLMLLLVAVLVTMKTTWIIGICLASYGIYYFLFRAVWESWPRSAEFTTPLRLFFFDNLNSHSLFDRVLKLFPFVFYFLFLILLLIPKIRKAYWN